MFQNLVRIIVGFSVIFLVSCGQVPVEAAKVGVDIGQEAPGFSLKDTGGKPVSLKDFRGEKIVILDFWASWCSPCLRAIPELNKLQKDYAEKDVQVLGINIQESPAKAISIKVKYMVKYPILLDIKGTVAKDYKVRGIPNLILVDKDGVVQYNGHAPFKLRTELEKLVRK